MFGLRSARSRAVAAGALGLLLLAGVATTAAVDRAPGTTLWLVIGLSAAAFLVAAGAVAMVIVSVVRPLAALRASARAITAGDLEARAKVSGPEEVVSLARDFNAMTDALSARVEELRASRQILETTTQGITDSILLLSKDFEILWANKTGLEGNGREIAEGLGKRCYEVTHGRESPCDDRLHPCPIHELQASGEPVAVTHTHLDSEGIETSLEITAYPIRDEQGEIVQFVHVSRDITERKRAEEALRESEAELSAIYDNAPPVMILVDEDRRVRKVNYTAVKFSQRSAEDMIGRRGGEALRCAHSLDDPEGCGFGASCGACPVRSVVVETFETGNDHYQVEANLELASAEGEVTVLVSTTLLSLTEGQRVLVCIEDISERKRAEEERERLLHNMGERIKELTCMYRVTSSARTREAIEEVIQDAVAAIPPAWSYPEITRAKVSFDGR